MQTMKQAAAEFLAGKRVAVTGISRNPQSHGSNVVYQRLRQRGYQVFAVNPNASDVEGDPCHHDLKSVPGGVDWVLIGTKPETAEATMHECADLGIKRVWMHRGPGAGSVSPAAADYGRQHGITVIGGGCPCMFGSPADVAVFQRAGRRSAQAGGRPSGPDRAADGHDEGARTPAARRQHRQSKLGFGERALLALGVPEGDFRDWAEITEWAKTIAGTIGEEGSSDVR